MAGDVKDVWTEQRLATGQYKDGSGKLGNLIYQIKRLFGCQVLRQQSISNGHPPAMNASQVAASRRLPEDQSRGRIGR
jgi:hypothetical protein